MQINKFSAKFFRAPFLAAAIKKNQNGFSLIELVITIAILSVLALGTVPLVQNAVRRQKEQKLREQLREMRTAIDEFHRDASGICTQSGAGQGLPPDGRSRVMISDCKIFEVDNLDRYPPTLEILVEGIEVKPRNQGAGGALTPGRPFGDNATEKAPLRDSGATDPKKKKYLRELPVDPITGKSDWIFRSPYQEKGDDNWDNVSLFDVRSAAEGETLDGVKYSDL